MLLNGLYILIVETSNFGTISFAIFFWSCFSFVVGFMRSLDITPQINLCSMFAAIILAPY